MNNPFTGGFIQRVMAFRPRFGFVRVTGGNFFSALVTLLLHSVRMALLRAVRLTSVRNILIDEAILGNF